MIVLRIGAASMSMVVLKLGKLIDDTLDEDKMLVTYVVPE
jgi:hypothetical protein